MKQIKTVRRKEWEALKKKEKKFLESRKEKSESRLNRLLAEKVPEQLRSKLNAAFEKAFSLIFRKGTGIIEKTYGREKIERTYQVNQYLAGLEENSRNIRAFSKSAGAAGGRNLIFSGVEGIGLGLLGIGLPDIPLFTGLILKHMYQLALSYGFSYDTEEERYWILLLIRGALSCGEDSRKLSREADLFIRDGALPEKYDQEEEIRRTAACLSGELLYMKFLQGIPLAGAVGGAYDVIYLSRIQKYAGIKYGKSAFCIVRHGGRRKPAAEAEKKAGMMRRRDREVPNMHRFRMRKNPGCRNLPELFCVLWKIFFCDMMNPETIRIKMTGDSRGRKRSRRGC